MFKNTVKIAFILVAALSLNVNASCKIPSRLLNDAVANDIAFFALKEDTQSVKILKSDGYDDYDDYSYSNDSFSKAIIQVQNNHKSLGDKYTKAMKARLKEKESAMRKGFAKVMDNCDKSYVLEVVTKNIRSALAGKNRTVERELLQLNLNSISDAMKLQ